MNPAFYLVESRVRPTSSEGFKTGLGDNETFETDFIGASEEDCQQWVQENAPQVNFIVPDLIAIADARSAKDGTILIQVYQNVLPMDKEEFEGDVPPCAKLPPRDKYNTWWSYRVDFKDAPDAVLDLGEFGIIEATVPYYGYKDRLADERGVFNVAKAIRITLGEDLEAVLGEDSDQPDLMFREVSACCRARL